MIYFDNAATSFYKPKCVKDAVSNSINKLTANPGRSGHDASQKLANIIYETREDLKAFFGANDHEVIFTKNCTEALNLAILGCLHSGDHVVTSIYEHNSVLRPLKHMQDLGVTVTFLDCELKDFANKLKDYIKPNTKMVITTSVSNVTGDKSDIEAIGKICREGGVLFLVDGAQGAGHIDLSLEYVDLFAFAGHKGLLTTTGVGGLIVRNNVEIRPIMFGGTGTDSLNLTQPLDIPEGFESGTIPTIPILSLNASLKFLSKNFSEIIKNEEILSNYLYNKLENLKFLKIYSHFDSINVFSFNIENMDSSEVANILNDDYGICVRSGLHCAPLIHKHLGTEKVGAVRVSIDFNNTKQEIDYLIMALKKIYAKTV